MNLEGMSAVKCCEMVLKHMGIDLYSNDIGGLIDEYGGRYYKESNLERRMRESDKIKSIKVRGQSWVKYRYVGGDV